VANRGDPDQDQRDQREHVDRPGHGAQDHHVDVPCVDLLVRRRAGRGKEMADRADRVVPPQPDPAQFVHRAAVRRVQRQGAFLMLARGRQVAVAQAHLAGEEMDVGLVRGQGPGPGRCVGSGVQPVGGQGGLSQAHVCLPVGGRKPARLLRRAQRVGVVAQVNEGVAGQPVRPLVLGVKGHRPVGHLDGLGVPVRAQVRTGHQAPGPAAVRLRRDDAGQQPRRLVVAPDVEHGRGARQFLPQLDHRPLPKGSGGSGGVVPPRTTLFTAGGACAGRRPGRHRRRPRWRTGRHCGRCRTRHPATV
jgi:hypothetical protein